MVAKKRVFLAINNRNKISRKCTYATYNGTFIVLTDTATETDDVFDTNISISSIFFGEMLYVQCVISYQNTEPQQEQAKKKYCNQG